MAVKDTTRFQLRKLTLFTITKRVSLLACAIAIAVSANGILLSTFVNAKTAATMTPTEEVTSLTYYATLGRCVQNNMYGDINLKVGDNGNTTPSRGGDSNNGAWFDDRDAWAKTFTSDNQACDDITKSALALWGWGTDYQQFLRDIGYQYQASNNPPRWHGPGDAGNGDTRRLRFEEAVQAKAYTQNFSGKPSISNSAWYELAQKNFYATPCSANDLGKIDSLSTDVKSRVTSHAEEGSTIYSSFYVVNRETRVPEDHGFSYQKPELDLVTLYGYRGSGQDSNNGAQMGCGELGKKMSDTAPGYALYLRANPSYIPPDAQASSQACSTNNTCTDSQSTCKVDGIGWMICPLSTSIAKGIHGLFDIVKGFLTFKSYSTDTNSGLYSAWSAMRNFANIAFVIAFMIIIYSQLTSVGITNYGIKKMLPRLIVAAILVNVSYWVCGIAVDVSNILGASIGTLIDSFVPAIKNHGVGVGWENATATILAGTAVGGIAIGATAAAAGSFVALLWMLVPILISAIFAILIAVLVLAARQVLLIILIVISPLAFVAYLLPNTSKWYDKWQGTFVTLLLMYPIIAIIFSGSQLASHIILSADNLDMTMVLLALAVQVIPLAIAPMVVKLSSGLLGRFAGIVNNPNRGPLDALKNRAKEKQELATKRGLDPNNRGLVNRLGQRRAYNRRTEKLQGEVHDSAADASWAGSTVANSKLQSLTQQKQSNAIAQNVANGANQTLTTSALASGPQAINAALGSAADNATIQKQIQVAVDEATSKSIKEAQISARAEIAPGNIPAMGKAFADAVNNNDSITARALQNMLLTSGSAGIDQYRKSMVTVENSLDPASDTGKELRKNLLDNHGGVKASANDLIKQAVSGDKMSVVSTSAGSWQMSDAELVHQKTESLTLALPHIDQEQAQRIITNEELAQNLSKEIRAQFKTKAGL
jgi:hypothetical protein